MADAAPEAVLITGASDGIGAELARQWAADAREGCVLVLAGRRADALAAVAVDCRRHGARAHAVTGDLAEPAACRSLVAQALAATGGRLDVLVNNAGMSAHAPLADTPALDWTEHLMRVNHWSAVHVTHAALPALVAARGRIVAVSSLAGLVGVPGRTAYCASKFAMTGFFEALRTELHDAGVTVTIAYPGVVATEIRRRGFDAHGRPAGVSGLDEAGAMPVDTCAQLILRAARRRDREVVMTAKGRLGRWLKLVMPGRVDAMARAALSREAAR